MIIKKASTINKKYKVALIVISVLIDFAIIGFMLVVTVSSIISSGSQILENDYSLIILSALATISLGDILLVFQKKSTLSFQIIKTLMKLNLFKRKKNNSIELSRFQQRFCEEIYGLETQKSFIYVYGNSSKGKTTTIICLLADFWDNCDSFDDLKNLKDVVFIDCTNSKDEIIDFFEMRNSVNTRISKFSKNLIVLDNVEKLGSFFMNENFELFSSSKSLFIIIEDTVDNYSNYSPEQLKKSLLVKNFNGNIIDIEKIDLLEYIFSLNHTEKKVFFVLYFITSFRAFASKKDVIKVLKTSRFKLYKAFKTIQKSKVFIDFPLNREYFYCSKKNSLKNIESNFKNDCIYNSVLKLLLCTEDIEPECRWVCLIKSPLRLIETLNNDERIKLFNKAIANGNYEGLYNELCLELTSNPSKEKVFYYERAFLAFYMGKHEESSTLFKKLIYSQKTENRKKEIILHIIESSHGDPSDNNMDNIEALINILKSNDDFYKLCADYWKTHIETERGIFDVYKFEMIRKKIMQYNTFEQNVLMRSIIHRCFTDELRCYHILGVTPPATLCNQYTQFLDTCKASRKEYYTNLYIKANTKHYIEIADMVMDGVDCQSIDGAVEIANQYYQNAMDSTYADKKSKRATLVKQLDLNMMYANFDYEKTEKEVKLFLLHSQINKVGVHEAFCMTLLIKSLILNPANITNDYGIDFSVERTKEIFDYYKNATRIYKEYRNKYGLFRLNFLLCLFLLLKNEKTSKNVFEKLEKLKKASYQYPRENKIIDELIKRNQNGNLTFMFILSVVRSYPIILQ